MYYKSVGTLLENRAGAVMFVYYTLQRNICVIMITRRMSIEDSFLGVSLEHCIHCIIDFLSLSSVETLPGGGDFISSLFGDCPALALPPPPALSSPSAVERDNNTIKSVNHSISNYIKG